MVRSLTENASSYARVKLYDNKVKCDPGSVEDDPRPERPQMQQPTKTTLTLLLG